MKYIKNHKIFEDKEKDETLLILKDLSLPIQDLGYEVSMNKLVGYNFSKQRERFNSIAYNISIYLETDIFVVYDINKKKLPELSKIKHSSKENELKEECLEFIERAIQADDFLYLCFFDIQMNSMDIVEKQLIEANLKFIKKQDGTEITDFKYKDT